MLLFHGSNSSIEKPLLLKASHPTDFETGFYATTNYDQAVDFAKRVVNLRKGLALVNIYELNEKEIEKNLILRFENPNVDWLHFVVNNRMSKPIKTNYDIIIGPVANDDVFKNQESMNKLVFKEVKNV